MTEGRETYHLKREAHAHAGSLQASPALFFLVPMPGA